MEALDRLGSAKTRSGRVSLLAPWWQNYLCRTVRRDPPYFCRDARGHQSCPALALLPLQRARRDHVGSRIWSGWVIAGTQLPPRRGTARLACDRGSDRSLLSLALLQPT